MPTSLHGTAYRKAELNVTPLIDVLLVLLIIFMVITPSLSRGLDAVVPHPADQTQSSQEDDVVVAVQGNGTVRLNEESVAVESLGDRLKAVFNNTANRVVFVRADKDLSFAEVAGVIDIAKGAGLDRVALMPRWTSPLSPP